jgi:hypothetical protein
MVGKASFLRFVALQSAVRATGTACIDWNDG